MPELTKAELQEQLDAAQLKNASDQLELAQAKKELEEIKNLPQPPIVAPQVVQVPVHPGSILMNSYPPAYTKLTPAEPKTYFSRIMQHTLDRGPNRQAFQFNNHLLTIDNVEEQKEMEEHKLFPGDIWIVDPRHLPPGDPGHVMRQGAYTGNDGY